MPTYYAQIPVDEFEALLQTPPARQSVITTWKSIMQRFREEKIVSKEKTVLHPGQALRHPPNRAGFMLNGFNAHANGSKVKRIGANREELHGAVAIEINPFPGEKEQQIQANSKVAAASKGLIPPPNGEEGYMPIGTGHMVSFCRAAVGGCITPFKDLQNGKKEVHFGRRLEVGFGIQGHARRRVGFLHLTMAS